MANRPSRLLVSIPKASADGRFYGRYPHGDAFPAAVQFQTPGAQSQIVVGGDISTSIRVRGTAAAQAAAAAQLSAQARFRGSPGSTTAATGALKTAPGIPQRYYPGHYAAILPFQFSEGTDTAGGFSFSAGSTAGGPLILQGDFSTGSIPGGSTGTSKFNGAALVRDVDGPAIRGTFGAPVCMGIVMPYEWVELEPTQNNYNLTRMIADLAQCIALGINLIPLITVRTFKSTDNPAPAYLNRLPYTSVYNVSGGGVQMARWNPFVMTRMDALIQKIGSTFDFCPNFYAIATQETACNLDDNNGPGGGYVGSTQDNLKYNADDYLDALKAEVLSIRKWLPRGRPFSYHNFIPLDDPSIRTPNVAHGGATYANAYALFVTANGGVIGGPDLLPDGNLNPGVYNDYVHVAAQGYPANGPSFIAAQSHSMTTQPGGGGNSFNGNVERNMTQLMDWATSNALLTGPSLGGSKVTGLFYDHIVWNFQTSGKYTYAGDVGPLMKLRPTFNTWS